MFWVVLQLIYVIDPPGRSLGGDVLWRRQHENREASPVLSLGGLKASDASPVGASSPGP